MRFATREKYPHGFGFQIDPARLINIFACHRSLGLSDVENVVVGMTAAFVEGVMLQPTLYWKNARAQGLPFTMNPSIIYRGTSTSILNEVQMMGLQFGLTGALQRAYMSLLLGRAVGNSEAASGERLTFRDEVVVATAGGMLSAFFSSPMELIMVQQQLGGGSIPSVATRVIRTHGVLNGGLWRGLLPCVMRDGIYTAGLLGVTPATQRMFVEQHGYSEQAAGVYASVVGGLGCAFLSHPFDLVKTCMQGDLERARFGSASSTVKQLYRSAGLERFFRGLMWRSINIVGTIYIANGVRVHASRAIIDWNKSRK